MSFGAFLTAYQIGSGYIASRDAEKARKRHARLMAEFQAGQDGKRAQLLEKQKGDVFEQASEIQTQLSNRVAKMIGRQRASLAGKGIEIDSGIGQRIQEETRRFGREDAATIRENAQREVWGLDNEIEQLYERADNAIKTGQIQSENIEKAGELERQSLVLGGLSNFARFGIEEQRNNQRNLTFSRSVS